ncbi:MAG: outer membrane beta-barrel family protein [Bacteroidetes bacterium]|nr:outer membrane beta-barrel family protein [Bacteroidota bacterium]
MKIEGTVIDTVVQKPLHHAVAMTIRISDSLLMAFSRTNSEGFFKMDSLPVDTYQVVISHPQFGDKDFILIGSKDNLFMDLKKIILPPKSITLTEVTVFGYADPVFYKGDTLIYTADSFKVKKNAVVEDLLKKLPGIKVEADGKIYSQGKKVDQVLVDGDEFFGSDPTIATKNLAANSVESVQVYDKKNESANENSSDDMLKVMNLQLKEDAKKGYFGKATAAGDFKDFYEGELLLNKFQGKRKLSLFAMSSNTPRSTFGWNDIYQYGLTNEQNTFMNDDGNMVSYWNDNRPQGIPKTIKSGFYYTDKIGKKTKVSLNYTYNQVTLNGETTTTSQYFLSDTTYKTNEYQHSQQQNKSHAANLTITQTIDSLSEIEVQSKVKYSTSEQNKTGRNSFLTNSGILARTTGIDNSSDGKNSDWNNSIKLTRNFKKRDRKLVANYNIGIITNESDGLLKSENTFYSNSVVSNDSLIDQKKTSTGNRQNQLASVSYTEPVGKKIKLEFSYDISLNTGTQDKKSFDFFNGQYSNENPTLTNNFKSTRTINRIGAKFMYEVKKYSFSAGTRVRQVEVSNTNLVTQDKLSQTTKNILPYMSYRYKFSDNHSLNFRYTTNSNQPDLNQLQPVPDNTNPNYIVKGNPALVPTYSHNFNLDMYSFKPVTGKNFWCSSGFTTADDAFANSTSYDSLGRTISQTVNVKGNYNVYAYLNLSIPLFSRMLELNPGFNYNMNHRSNFINDVKNITMSSRADASMNIRLHIDTLEFSIGGNYSFNSTSSSLNTQSNQSYSSHGFDASLSLELPLKMKIETDASYEINKQRAAGYNLNYILWNASLSKSFLKNENLIFAIDATDMLNQNINTNRDIRDNVISDIKSTVIGRYILLKATFKINSNKKKDDEEGD